MNPTESPPKGNGIIAASRHLLTFNPEYFATVCLWSEGHADALAIAIREIVKSCDSNFLPVKKKRKFSEFLTLALPVRRGGWGDRRKLAG